MLRVRADIIDRLVNEAGEVAIARARVEGELRALKANLLELTGSVIRLRAQVREIEIQAESQIQSRMTQVRRGGTRASIRSNSTATRASRSSTRSLAEGVNDVSTVQQSLLKNLDDADAALIAQARLSRDVQQQLFSIRTVPFGSLSERLYRILRATAKELDKRANLEIRGAQTELDRSVLEKLVGPLEHLLRNALDHGIESRAARAAAGKSETGEISLTVRQVGNEIVIELADDGAGLNLDAHPREGASRRAASPPTRQPTDAQLIECIFQPGFSTASQGHAGLGPRHRHGRRARGDRGARRPRRGDDARGQRHDVPALPAADAGGRAGGAGARRRPAVGAARADGRAGAAGEGRGARQPVRAAPASSGRGASYPFHYLPRLLGDPQHNPETTRYNPVLLLRSGQSVAADPCRRNDRQPGSRREEHRAAARARVRHRGRDGARHRRDRADHQSGAARAARRRAGLRPERRARGADSAEDGRQRRRAPSGRRW